MKTDQIVIGKILNTHGIKGTIKVQPITSDINRFNDLTSKMATFVANLEVYDSTIGESYINNTWQLSPKIDSL